MGRDELFATINKPTEKVFSVFHLNIIVISISKLIWITKTTFYGQILYFFQIFSSIKGQHKPSSDKTKIILFSSNLYFKEYQLVSCGGPPTKSDFSLSLFSGK